MHDCIQFYRFWVQGCFRFGIWKARSESYFMFNHSQHSCSFVPIWSKLCKFKCVPQENCSLGNPDVTYCIFTLLKNFEDALRRQRFLSNLSKVILADSLSNRLFNITVLSHICICILDLKMYCSNFWKVILNLYEWPNKSYHINPHSHRYRYNYACMKKNGKTIRTA